MIYAVIHIKNASLRTATLNIKTRISFLVVFSRILHVTYLKMTRQYVGGQLLMMAVPPSLDMSELQITEDYE